MTYRRLAFAVCASLTVLAAFPRLAVAQQDCDPLKDVHCRHHRHRGIHAVEPAAPAARPLIPVREYLKATDIPPSSAGAYGIVAFSSKATPATRAKLIMVCRSFVAHFPPNDTVPASVPVSDRMFTVWPLDNPRAAKATADDCNYVVDHYDLFAAESAIGDAERQQASFNGDGPFLIGWSPSDARGKPDKLVLVVDMSEDKTQSQIDREFTFWKDKIVEDPQLWRSGFSVERFRIALHDFADEYGSDVLASIKLVGITH